MNRSLILIVGKLLIKVSFKKRGELHLASVRAGFAFPSPMECDLGLSSLHVSDSSTVKSSKC